MDLITLDLVHSFKGEGHFKVFETDLRLPGISVFHVLSGSIECDWNVDHQTYFTSCLHIQSVAEKENFYKMLSNFFYLLSGRASGAETSISISRNEICTYPHEMFFSSVEKSSLFSLWLPFIGSNSRPLCYTSRRKTEYSSCKEKFSKLKFQFYVVSTMLFK